MAYILASVALFFIVTATALILTRAYWRQHIPNVHLPGAGYIYSRLPGSFAGDIESGLSSSNFDLSGNVEAGDSRAGLDDASKAEILKIMKKRRMTFDQARKAYMETRFKQNGIGPDGRPRDPKFVSFS
ncbi:protein precursor [Drechmeria coniospora]|uniref:Protein n=1 Tax=Drechmeria coniospora TaxID=98403 RepID=A0A151GXQ9_DRECN|nr:protein precursor [Drechmeria coniospora]KYK61888.1 protein precursor [Drechmeria coniospora]ODA82699.1 hypothetical protein RJ55_01208 [Drechmeria coniospora]